MAPAYGAAGVAVSVERIDMGEGFPALYRCNFEVLLVDRRIPKRQTEREGNPRRGDVCDKEIQPPIIGEAFVNGYSRGYRKNIDQRDGDKARRAVTENEQYPTDPKALPPAKEQAGERGRDYSLVLYTPISASWR